MEEKAATDFCKKWLGAWTGNRPESLILFYSDDAFYRDPAKPDGLKGREQILPYFHKLLAKYPEWVWEVSEIFVQPNGFILKWKARLKPQDQKYFFGMDIVELKDNKITRNEVYFDASVFSK